jgi:DnaJ-class molecular chaperone
LGVPITASETEVRTAWRTLSKKWHPDTYQTDDPRVKEMAAEKFDTIQKTYEQIKQLKGWK